MTEPEGRRIETPTLRPGSVREVFAAFLKLGLTSFGGPIAHLGYFRRELVERRGWLDEAQYAQLVALCQFLPGPASSQVGFSIGLIRAGWPGAIAAFVAFTAPSVLMLLVFVQLLPLLDSAVGQATIHGLKLLAVVVVAHALLGMVRNLTPDGPRRLIAALMAAIVAIGDTTIVQVGAIAAGAVLGMLFCRHVSTTSGTTFELRYTHRVGLSFLAFFAVLLAWAFVPIHVSPLAAAVAAFYRAGALVFGGGHVVLPLLDEAIVAPGWINEADFLTGYGLAQALPGPMFSVAAFLGARLDGAQGSLVYPLACVVAILLPGLLLVASALPAWHAVARHPNAARALAGINAAVVGLLAAALYDPVWTSAVLSTRDFAIAIVGFALLVALRASPLLVLVWCVAAAML